MLGFEVTIGWEVDAESSCRGRLVRPERARAGCSGCAKLKTANRATLSVVLDDFKSPLFITFSVI